MTDPEKHLWEGIREILEFQCANIAGYILDHIDDPECKGFNLKTLNGITTIKVIGKNVKRRQEKLCTLEISEEMPERWRHTHVH